MAESFLSPIIEKLIEFLSEEVQSLRGVDREVKSLIDELEIIEPLLQDAEFKSERGEQNDAVKAWLRQLREEANHIESVILEYRYRLSEVKFGSGFRGSLRRAGNCLYSLKSRHEIASQVKTIKQSLSDIKRRARDYGLRPLEQVESTSSQAHVDPRMASLFVKDNEFVDVNSISEELKRYLAEGLGSRSVITLVGEGGIGKTTLAKKVFDDDVVSRHFDSVREWITVSQPYNLKKVLIKMKQKICKEERSGVGEDDTIEELINCLSKHLEAKRYVFVFDDVWEEKFWEDIKLALPSNDKGSRVLITTRNRKIAESCKETPADLIIKDLQPWSQTHAWDLFCKKAFQGKCPHELEQLSVDIVNKCIGLPLVIASIASLLAAQEKVVSEWQRVLNDLNSKARSSSHVTRVQEILSLGYYDLPYHLRFCFLYFSLFPEDYSIEDERLYRLWIAEGFIKAKANKTLEEVAEEYLNELTKRNLVLIDQTKLYAANYFQVHDLMREVILSKAEDIYFCKTWDVKESRLRGKGHHLTLSSISERHLKNVESSGIHSLFLFDINDELTEPSMVALLKKFKLLEVFDIQDTPLAVVPIKTVPKEVGNLFCLKYLSLRNTKVKVLPKTISKLRNLQSLDICNTLVRELPEEVNKLRNLHHILAYSLDDAGNILGVSIQKGFGDLEELQTLGLVDAHTSGSSFIKELEKLIKLRNLQVSNLTTSTGNALCCALEKLDYLEWLSLIFFNENEVIDLQYRYNSLPLQLLRELVLVGRLEKLPEWILKLKNLTRLYLKFSKLTDETVKFLKRIPNLENLNLNDQAYVGEELHLEEGDFLKLKRIFLFKLRNLKTVKIDRGAVPILEHLEIFNCRQLKEMPSFQHLINLKYVELNEKRLK